MTAPALRPGPPSAPPVLTRVRRPFAALVSIVAIVASIDAVVIRVLDPAPILPNTFGFGDAALVGFTVFGASFTLVGALLVVRRPENAIGWFMTVVGLSYSGAALGAAVTYAAVAAGSTTDPIAGWAGWLTVLLATLGGYLFLLALIFPDGRGATPAWHRVAQVCAVGVTVLIVTFLIQPGPLQLFRAVDNPIPIGPDLRPIVGLQLSQLTTSLAGFLAPAAAFAMIVRYRRSDIVVRRQLKWFVFSMTVSVAAISAAGFASSLTDRPPEVALALFGAGGAFVAIAIGIAILRHGLYDIDRIISRTLGYGVLTAIFAIVFGAIVVASSSIAGSVVAGQQSETVAVAVATLVVAVLAGPLRRRVQTLIDRRFDRAHYDAARTAIAFADRLRDETDLDTVTGDLGRTTRDALAPAALAVWIRGRPSHQRDERTEPAPSVTIPGHSTPTVTAT